MLPEMKVDDGSEHSDEDDRWYFGHLDWSDYKGKIDIFIAKGLVDAIAFGIVTPLRIIISQDVHMVWISQDDKSTNDGPSTRNKGTINSSLVGKYNTFPGFKAVFDEPSDQHDWGEKLRQVNDDRENDESNLSSALFSWFRSK